MSQDETTPVKSAKEIQLEERAKLLAIQVKDLEAKLKERDNSAVEQSLDNKARAILDEIEQHIGNAVNDIETKYGVYMQGVRFSIRYDAGYSSYSRGKYQISFVDTDDQKKIMSQIKAKQFKDFTEALNNFAWAVQNGPQP